MVKSLYFDFFEIKRTRSVRLLMMCNVDSKRKEEFLSFYLSFSRKIGKEIFGEFSENIWYQKKSAGKTFGNSAAQ